MYSQKVVQARLDSISKVLPFKLIPLSLDLSARWSAHLQSLWDPAKNDVSRPLTKEESAIVGSERVLCKYDYKYWAERYSTLTKDGVEGGGIGHLRMWESQEIILKHFAAIEEEQFQALNEGFPVDGIRTALHKARQLGATALSRSVTIHRVTLWRDTRCMAGSVDDDKILELYDRDRLILDNLPWYLKPLGAPDHGFDVKAQHLSWDPINSKILYQTGTQKTGFGQGRQFELGHLTEVASFPYPDVIQLDFFPTLPQSIWTLCILESTAQGRGNWWHSFTEAVRYGRRRGWNYIFVPYYVEVKKYRANPPANWIPMQITLQHAEQVERTSPEWCFGNTVRLTREQMYWWESERATALEDGKLSIFKTNFCSTVEESFQHSAAGAFREDILERIRLTAGSRMVPYEVITSRMVQ